MHRAGEGGSDAAFVLGVCVCTVQITRTGEGESVEIHLQNMMCLAFSLWLEKKCHPEVLESVLYLGNVFC